MYLKGKRLTMYERLIDSELETEALARKLAEKLRPADVLTLEGAPGRGDQLFDVSGSHAGGLGISETVHPGEAG